MLVLDSDHMSVLAQRGTREWARLTHLLEQAPGEIVATTIITYEEQFRGWMAYLAKANSLTKQVAAYKRLAKHARRYRRMRLLGFHQRAAKRFQELKTARVNVGTNDLKIASIVLTWGPNVRLLSRNLKDFDKVPGLPVEDWVS